MQGIVAPKIHLESVTRCALCQSAESDAIFKAVKDYLCGIPGSFRYVQCRNCKLVYQEPRPVAESLIDCYVDYHTHETEELPSSFSGPWQGPNRWVRGGILAAKYGYRHLAPSNVEAVAANILDLLPPVRSRARCGLGSGKGSGLPVFRGNGRALDIGTGGGIYAATLARLGWSMTCVEFDEVTAANTARRLNLNVFAGSVEQANFESNSFDFISMFHVIEHLPDPVATLRECYRILDTGARIMVRTPNFDSLVRRLFGRFWRGIEAPRHLFLFSADSLRRAVELAGFQVAGVCTTGAATPYYLRMSREARSGAGEHHDNLLLAGIQDRVLNLVVRTGSRFGVLLGDSLHLEAVKP